MDFDNISPSEFGQSLSGIGINLLSPDVGKLAEFLKGVFRASTFRVSNDFAIVVYQQMILQIHHDGTYHSHPLLGMLPDNPPRGAGAQFYMFGTDPDQALAQAERFGGSVLEPAREKPHGLYEGTVLSPEGYAFTPAVPIRTD